MWCFFIQEIFVHLIQNGHCARYKEYYLDELFIERTWFKNKLKKKMKSCLVLMIGRCNKFHTQLKRSPVKQETEARFWGAFSPCLSRKKVTECFLRQFEYHISWRDSWWLSISPSWSLWAQGAQRRGLVGTIRPFRKTLEDNHEQLRVDTRQKTGWDLNWVPQGSVQGLAWSPSVES